MQIFDSSFRTKDKTQTMLRRNVLIAQLCIISYIFGTGFAIKSPKTYYDVKNFYKKFVMDPSYHSLNILQRKDLNSSYLEHLTEDIEDVPDISTTPFNLHSSTANSFGPLELHKADKKLVSPIEVYSRKKMLQQIMNNKMQELSSMDTSNSDVQYIYDPNLEMASHYNDPEMMKYYYGLSDIMEDEVSTILPENLYEKYQIVQDSPVYTSQIPRPKPMFHPRPYDWENYRRRPKLQELPPSYVIVGSPVPDSPSPEMPKEPVKTEEDKISEYEKDYKILPGGINSYLKHKLKFEVDWITIAKILLKLIIFKKIFKFIIILGLLLFVPKYYKWSNTYLNDNTNTTTTDPPYYYDKWHHKWDKFHQYKYPRRKRTTTTTTTTTTSTTTEKNCNISTTTAAPTTTR